MQQTSHGLNMQFIAIRPSMRARATSIVMLFPIGGVAQQEIADSRDVSALLPDAPKLQQDSSIESHAAAAA